MSTKKCFQKYLPALTPSSAQPAAIPRTSNQTINAGAARINKTSGLFWIYFKTGARRATAGARNAVKFLPPGKTKSVELQMMIASSSGGAVGWGGRALKTAVLAWEARAETAEVKEGRREVMIVPVAVGLRGCWGFAMMEE